MINNLNFGTSTFSNTIDPNILQGWGVRPSDWQWSAGVQHEILPRTSVEVAFVHREFYGFAITDNLAVSPSDFTQFSITAPQDPRLPDGGGYQVGPLYDLNNPALFGVTRNFITYSDTYGNAFQKFNGIDVNVSARPRNGLTVQGGFAGGYSTADVCEIRAKVPEMVFARGLTNPYCHIETGFLPQYKGIATYVVPKIDVTGQRHVHEQAWHPGERLWHARGGRRLRRQLHHLATRPLRRFWGGRSPAAPRTSR